MTTLIIARLKKSDWKTNIDKYRVTANKYYRIVYQNQNFIYNVIKKMMNRIHKEHTYVFNALNLMLLILKNHGNKAIILCKDLI